EDPAPARVVDDQPADRRAEDRRQHRRHRDDAHHAPHALRPAAAAIIICPTGRSIPPPIPCRTRNKISCVVEPANPQSAEPAVKRTSERRYKRRGPKRRAAHPVTGITAASASM